MDVTNRICLVVGFFAGGLTILCSATVLTWIDKVRARLNSRKGQQEILVATLRQISTQQQELLEGIQALKSTHPAAPKRRSQTKKATHQQKHVNGKDETTEESVQ